MILFTDLVIVLFRYKIAPKRLGRESDLERAGTVSTRVLD